MKFVTILLFAACLQTSARTYSQSVSLSEKNATLEKIFKEIKKQTGFTFWYQEELLQNAKKVTLSVKNVQLQEALQIIFKDQSLTYTIVEKTIVVKAKPSNTDAQTILKGFFPPPPIDVKGKVVNENGEPLTGVTVTVNGTKSATSTDVNGYFEIKNVDENATLVFTSVNMETFDVKVNGKTELAISLKTKVTALSDVGVTVNTGYQTIPKERATGSFVQIDNQLLNRRVSTGIMSRLEDLVPGLIFNRNSSTSFNTASSSSINIRGQSTIFGKADPLIVIDNFPYDGDLNNINPNDVESITVLKDAAAASIWGARAGNGVIVINMKKGILGRAPKVSFNSNFTIGNKPDLFYQPQMSSAEFIELEKMLFGTGYYQATEASTSRAALSPVVELLIAKRDRTMPAAQADAGIEALKNYDTRNDLQHYAYRNSLNRQYSLNLSGGGENQKYYLSAGYDQNLNTHKATGYERVTLSANNSYTLLKGKLEFTGSVFFTKTNTQPDYFDYNPRYDLSTTALIYPYARLADEDGNPLAVNRDLRSGFAQTAPQSGLLDWQYHPLEEIALRDHKVKTTDLRINAAAKFIINDYLNANVIFMYNNTFTDNRNLQNQQTYFTRNLINTFTQVAANGSLSYPIPEGGILDVTHSTALNRNFRVQLNYSRVWTGKHELNAIGGFEIKELNIIANSNRMYGYNEERSAMRAVSYLTSYKRYQSLTGATSTIPYIDAESDLTDRYKSYYGQGAYTFDNRYTLSASTRLDQSNLFGVKANQKGVPLYSVGVAWNLHSEKFYNLQWLPYLKLRLTYGYNGNVYKNISALTTASTSTSYSATPNTGLPYATITNPPNPELRWERVKMLNLGLDFTMKNSRLGGTLEIYQKQGIDLIGNLPYDPTTGISTFRGNNARTLGEGIDLNLNSRNIEGEFKWSSNVILSYIKERVISYKVKASGFNYPITTGLPLEGKPLYAIYSYPYAGLDPLTGDPQGYLNGVVSRNYSAIINAATPENLIYNGASRPTVFGSLRNTFTWNNISLSANIVYRGGYYFRKTTINYFQILKGSNGHGDYGLRWQKPGDELFTQVPSMPVSANSRNDAIYLSSDLLALKGDHIRFQDINISYDLNRARFRNLPFGSLQLYMYVNNVGIVWRANGFNIDPDYQQTGPPPLTVSLGLKANL